MLFHKSRAVDYMRRHDLDALVAASPVNVTYFSDYFCWLDPLLRKYMMSPGASSEPAMQSYAVFPIEGEPALVIHPLLAVNAADLWIRDLRIFADPGWDDLVDPDVLPERERSLHDRISAQRKTAAATTEDALVSVLASRGLTDARIGLDAEDLSPRVQDALRRALPHASIRNCTNLIRLIRMVKSPEEIARLIRAAEINEHAAMEALTLADAGKPIAHLVRHFRTRAAELNADFDHFAYGMRGVGLATEPDYVLGEGEVLYVDFGCNYRQYFSDSGATLALAEPPPMLRTRHTALRACLEAGVSAIRPDVTASEVHDAMRHALQDYGSFVSYPHGHGLGLEVRDYPILVPDGGLRIRDECVDVPSDLSLEADMVINLEASIFLPGMGSLNMEKSFVVSADGSRELIAQDRRYPVQPRCAVESSS